MVGSRFSAWHQDPLWDGACDCCVCPGSDLTPGTSSNIDKLPEFLHEEFYLSWGLRPFLFSFSGPPKDTDQNSPSGSLQSDLACL